MKRFIYIYLFSILFTSCGPVNYFTRIKKIPREYSFNYCGETIKAPSSDINKEMWVVFSDRDENHTYQNPGGKVKFKKANFLEAFFVIKEKGDYLKLVKYDPSIIENDLLSTKFKDRDKAEYYGWIHKSKVVLNKYSTTDISSSFQDKSIIMISDTTSINNLNLYLNNDSIKVFKDPQLTTEQGLMGMYNIVFPLKYSNDRKKILISHKQKIHPDSASTDIAGWIHSSLIQNIGQRLFVSKKSIHPSHFLFTDKTRVDTIHINDSIIESLNLYTRNYDKVLKNSPATSFLEIDSAFKLKIRLPMSIVDQSNNYIFNVNGDKIYFNQFKKLEKDLNQFNIVFVFESKKGIIENFSAMINVIQNLQPFFEQTENINYNYGAVLAVGSKTYNITSMLKVRELTPNYQELLEFLISESEIIDRYAPIPTRATWRGVRRATEMLSPHKNETNLLVILGESGYAENVDSTLVKKISDLNTRILGFQLHGSEDNEGNNFVLQVENLINYYADRNKTTKRDKIVFTNQLNNNNRYREVAKNVYALDYPARSMSQGWVLFPEKGSLTPLDILASTVDSIVCEINADNANIIDNLDLAFNTVGNHRYAYDSTFIHYFHQEKPIDKKISQYFKKMPLWYIPTSPFNINKDSISDKPAFSLLLSKEELDELIEFFDLLSAQEPDYQYVEDKTIKSKKKCNCPDDDEPIVPMPTVLNENGEPEYRSTKKIRKYIQNIYIKEMRSCKLCKYSKKEIKSYNLAYAQQKITGCPSYSTLLKKYTINDITNKKIISDKELDLLITYFKTKKEELLKYVQEPDSFVSNNQTYFWLNQNYLP